MAQRVQFAFDVVDDDDKEYRVICGPRDLSRWERTYKGRSLAKLEADARMEWLEEIAYVGAQRAGRFGGPLNEFRDLHDIHPIDLEAERRAAEAEEDGDDEDDEAGPTRSAR